MNTKTFRLISSVITVLIACCFIATGILCRLAAREFNETLQYQVYNDVKDGNVLDDLLSYCSENQIEYHIEQNRMTLKDFNELSFSILENGSYHVNESSLMTGFEILDNKDYGIVTVEGENINGNIREKITYKYDSYTVSKINSEYYYSNNFFVWIVFFVIFGIALFMLLIIVFFMQIKHS